MQECDEQVPLTPEEIKELQSKKTGGFACLIVLLIIIAGVIAWEFTWLAEGRLFTMAVTLMVGALPAAFFLWYALKIGGKIKRDLSGGLKRVYRGPMESQRMTSREKKRSTGTLEGTGTGELDMTYLIKVAGKEYPVSIQTYMAIRPGEFVEVQEAIHSDTVFRVTPIAKAGSSAETDAGSKQEQET